MTTASTLLLRHLLAARRQEAHSGSGPASPRTCLISRLRDLDRSTTLGELLALSEREGWGDCLRRCRLRDVLEASRRG